MKPGDKRLDYAWNIGYAYMKEDDTRRHKSRCVWYKQGDWCEKGLSQCIGSSHCRYYRENTSRPHNSTEPLQAPPKNTKHNISPSIAADASNSLEKKPASEASAPPILTPHIKETIIAHLLQANRKQECPEAQTAGALGNDLTYRTFVGKTVRVKKRGEGVIISATEESLDILLTSGGLVCVSLSDLRPGDVSVKL